MVAVAFLLVWGGWSAGLWGWCLIRDYDVTFGQLVNPVRPYAGPWPPARIPDGQTWPSGAAPARTAAAATAAPAAPGGAAAPDQTAIFPVIEPGGKITPGTG